MNLSRLVGPISALVRSRLAIVVLAICYASIVIAAIVYWSAASRASARALRLESDLEQARLLVRHLAYHIKAQPLEERFLSGRDALGDTSIVMPLARDGVYVLVSAECPLTPRNYPSLAAINRSGVRLFGLSLKDDPTALMRHLRSYGISYPVIVDAEGALIDAIPKFGTPFLAAVRNGRFSLLKAGVLDSTDVAEILAAAAHQNPAK